MYKDIVEIRILPNDKVSFPMESDFRDFIEKTLVERGGKYLFPNHMMQCEGRTLVLFQYDGMVRAVGVLVEAKKERVTDEQGVEFNGYYRFEMETVHYLSTPIATEDLRKVHPEFIGFNQSKQRLSITCKEAIVGLLEDKDSYFKKRKDMILIKLVEDNLNQMQLQGTDRATMVKARVNQEYFRERLLTRYNKCCLCGVSNPKLLVAGHIKPWADADPSEKLDIENGFLFCPNHDRLFDQGFISFADDGTICISTKLSADDRDVMNVQETDKIAVTEGNKSYLEYHRANIFKK